MTRRAGEWWRTPRSSGCAGEDENTVKPGRMARLLPASLSARMTLLVALGAAAAITLSLALLYVVLSEQLSQALDSGLLLRSQDLATSVRTGDTDVLAGDPLAQLYAPGGSLLASSPSLGGRHQRLLTPGAVRAVTGPVTTTTSVRLGRGPEPVRLLSRRLRPVATLTRQAAVISSLDTDRRLDPVPGDDEIARLAQTLEAMLARLRTAFAREGRSSTTP